MFVEGCDSILKEDRNSHLNRSLLSLSPVHPGSPHARHYCLLGKAGRPAIAQWFLQGA